MDLDYKTKQNGESTVRHQNPDEVDAVKRMLNYVLPDGETSWEEVTHDYYNSLYDTKYVTNKVDLSIVNGKVTVQEL